MTKRWTAVCCALAIAALFAETAYLVRRDAAHGPPVPTEAHRIAPSVASDLVLEAQVAAYPPDTTTAEGRGVSHAAFMRRQQRRAALWIDCQRVLAEPAP